MAGIMHNEEEMRRIKAELHAAELAGGGQSTGTWFDHATAAPTLRDEVSEAEIDSAWSDLQARMAAEPDHIERQRAQFAALRHRPAGDPWGANSPPAALNDWATKWAQPADLPSKPPPLPRWLKVTAGIVFVYLVVLIVMALAGQPPVH